MLIGRSAREQNIVSRGQKGQGPFFFVMWQFNVHHKMDQCVVE